MTVVEPILLVILQALWLTLGGLCGWACGFAIKDVWRQRGGPGWWRRVIVRAAPTCTLWRYPKSLHRDVVTFVFWPGWEITGREMMQEGGTRRRRR